MRHRTIDSDDFDEVDPSNPEDFGTTQSERVGGPYSCTWYLNYDSSSLGIDVFDIDSPEDSASSTCQSPAFFSSGSSYSSSSDFRQSDAYWWAKASRDYYLAYGSSIARSNSDSVSIFIDMPGSTCNKGIACFVSSSNTIYIETQQEVDTHIHEYGHYVHSLYGDWGSSCSTYTDDSDSISEAMADLFTVIVMLDEVNDNDLDYGVSWRRFSTGCNPCTERRHFGTTILSYNDLTCTATSEHFASRFFSAAMWEVLFNRDCDEDSNCTATTKWGSDIGWSSRAQARQAILRASLYASKILGNGSVTYDDVGFWMYVYLSNNYSSTIANNFKKVIEHHGLDI